MRCELVQRHMGALVDGELDPATHVEFERHIDACVACQELLELDHLIREELRQRASSDESSTPHSLEERVRVALLSAKIEPSEARPLVQVLPFTARRAVPLVAAAAVFLVIGGVAVTDDETVQGASLLEDVVQLHRRQLPADVADSEPTQVSRYFQDKVEFPVRPARFDQPDARLIGARVSNVRDRRAAALYYEIEGRRVTVVVFPSEGVGESPAVQRVRMGNNEIAYRNVRGYSVPIRVHNGLAYAFTGDIAQERLMRLAASARVAY